METRQIEIRQYLLGELESAKRMSFEGDLLTNPDLLEELSICEEELIDDFIAGELSVQEKTLFESYFLKVTDRRDELNFAKSLKVRLKNIEPTTTISTVSDSPKHPKHSWRNLFSFPNNPFRFAVAGFAILFVFGTLFVILNQNKTKQLTNLEQEITQLNSRSADILKNKDKLLTIGLLPGIMRDIDSQPISKPSPDVEFIQLQLAVNNGSTTVYHARLLKNNQTEIFALNEIQAHTENNSQEVWLFLPAKSLSEGSYILDLSVENNVGKPEKVGTYSFKLEK